jgi:hypothetical protein
MFKLFGAATEWICPENFPDLSGYPYVAIDLETKDPDLKSRGSGRCCWTRRNYWSCCSCRRLVRLLSNWT